MPLSLRERVYAASPIWLQNVACSFEGRRLVRQRYGSVFEEWDRRYRRSATWPESDLRAFQREQLREVIAEAFEVPFYRDRWRADGLSPDDFRDLDDLAKFPFTTKEALFEAGEGVIASRRSPASLMKTYTSGSTGMPLARYFTSDELQRHYAAYWHRLRPGVDRTEYYATFQGKEIVLRPQSKPPYWRENRAMNQRLYSIGHLGPDHLAAVAQSLDETPFAYYQGYVSIMAVVAEYMHAHGLTVSTPPRAVFCTSETLSDPMKKLMGEVWRARVYNEYCQVERSAMICECEHGRLHVQHDYGMVEFIAVEDPLDDVPLHEMVVTGFIPRAAPLVRYRIGDLVRLSDETCPCGRVGPVVEAIHGRTADVIVLPDGRKYPHISIIVDLLRNVRHTQVVQDARDHIVVRFVPFDAFTDADHAHLIRTFSEQLGGEIAIRVERVTELERTSSGKIKSIINRLPA